MLGQLAELASCFNRDPEEVIRWPMLQYLGWCDAMEWVWRGECGRAQRVQLASNGLEYERSGRRAFARWMNGPQSKKAEELEDKVRNLGGMLLGLGESGTI